MRLRQLQGRRRSFRTCFFDFNIVLAAVTATFLTVIDPSNSCTLLGRFDLIAIVSYDFVLYNTWPLSNIAR